MVSYNIWHIQNMGNDILHNKSMLGDKMITKQMLEDISKLKDDYVVCDGCGSSAIIEEAWIDVNDCITIEGNTYYRFSEEIHGDTFAICEDCNDACKPIHIKEYKEKE